MAFVLKSILSDMSIMTPTFLSFLFAWNVFFHHLTFNLCVSFALKWISCRQHIVGSCFLFIQSASLCLLIGAFGPLTFKVIVDRYVFIATLNLVFQLIFYFLFVPFCFTFCSLMVFFCSMLELVSFWFLWIYCMFFIYCYHGV